VSRYGSFVNVVVKSVALLALGCGGLTSNAGPDAGDAASPFDSGAPGAPTCTKPPWVVFDYMQGGATSYRIYAMHPDGTAFHALDLGPMRATLPAISRDGTKLVYDQYDDSGPNETEGLMLFDVTTKASTPVGWPATVILYWSAISPDDQFVVYSSAYMNTFITGANGSGLRQLIQPNGGNGAFPVFSNDSSTVYFVASGKVSSVRADGTDFQTLTTGAGDIGEGLALSPDGTRVVVPVLCAAKWQLRIFSLAALPGDSCTAGTTLLPDFMSNGVAAVHPSWSDADLIVYSDTHDLQIVAASGGAPTNITSQLTASGGWASDAVWASGCSDF